MAKLYFKYGVMGCSKSAQALITKFNYEERGMKVLLIKPAIDTRDGKDVVKSRIGLSSEAYAVSANENLYDFYVKKHKDNDVIIVDECQFLTTEQVDRLGDIVIDFNVPVLCFGLACDFTNHLFEGSKRLFEIAESVAEIKSVCRCGAKATVTARFDDEGHILYKGEQVVLGGNNRYTAMCRKCWLKRKAEQESQGIFL